MRLRRTAAGAAFVIALLAIYVVRSIGWPEYVVLVLGVSMLGGYLIGESWAVWASVATNLVFMALYLPAYEYVFTVRPDHDGAREAAVLIAHTILGAIATALGVRTRRRRATGPLASPT